MKTPNEIELDSTETGASGPASSPTLKSFSILEAIANAERPVSLGEIVQQLGIPKPTAHRMLAQLEAGGLIARDINGHGYGASPRLQKFALDVLTHDSLRRQRYASLQKLVHRIGETCNLTVMDKSEVLYLERIETPSPLRMSLQPGTRVPLHCTASGKLFLSQMTPHDRHQLIVRLPLQRYTPHTITDPDLLEAELDRLHAKEWSIDNEEFVLGSVCLAVPVKDLHGRCCAAVAMSAPSARVPIGKILDFLPALREAAEEIASTLTMPITG